MIPPAALAIIFAVGGTAAAATYTVYDFVEKSSAHLTLSDLRPALPFEGLPLPVFIYKKPEVLENLRRG